MQRSVEEANGAYMLYCIWHRSKGSKESLWRHSAMLHFGSFSVGILINMPVTDVGEIGSIER